MKVVSVQVLGNEDFRSLKVNMPYRFSEPKPKDKEDDEDDFEIDTHKELTKTVFTGVNGSGKSNFLQLLSEIFAYLETYHLAAAEERVKVGANFGFQIFYTLHFTEEVLQKLDIENAGDINLLVRITKELNKKPEFAVQRPDRKNYIDIPKHTELVLPDKVVAYSSGQNEMLSNPYYRLKYYYFRELEKNDNKHLFDDRLIFIDYSNSQSLFIANFLLSGDKQLSVLKEHLHIKDVVSFRISINLLNYRKNELPMYDELREKIELLKQCATSWVHRKGKPSNREDLLILDYHIDDTNAVRDAFKAFFGSAANLYQTFYQLDVMNIHQVASDTRVHIVNAPKWVNFKDEIGEVEPAKLSFRIEKIDVEKITGREHDTQKTKTRYYRSLSDGEHQFSLMLGAVMLFEEGNVLYLFDEPETHFNPKWKYDYLTLLDSVAPQTDSQILLTTHDPVLLSGLRKEQVMTFRKAGNGDVSIRQAEEDLIGMGVDGILTGDIFGMNTTVDNETYQDMIRRRELLVLKEKDKMTTEQSVELTQLSEKLIDIDYNKPFEDPLYRDFIMALGNLDMYKADLTPEERKKREAIAARIIQDLRNKLP